MCNNHAAKKSDTNIFTPFTRRTKIYALKIKELNCPILHHIVLIFSGVKCTDILSNMVSHYATVKIHLSLYNTYKGEGLCLSELIFPITDLRVVSSNVTRTQHHSTI